MSVFYHKIPETVLYNLYNLLGTNFNLFICLLVYYFHWFPCWQRNTFTWAASSLIEISWSNIKAKPCGPVCHTAPWMQFPAALLHADQTYELGCPRGLQQCASPCTDVLLDSVVTGGRDESTGSMLFLPCWRLVHQSLFSCIFFSLTYWRRIFPLCCTVWMRGLIPLTPPLLSQNILSV